MDGLVADVVIVGFGAAGACAAIEAADAGADVLILDRFGGEFETKAIFHLLQFRRAEPAHGGQLDVVAAR